MIERGKPPATDPAHGKAPVERTITEHLRMGCVNLDKPAGPTSHQIVAWLKDALEIPKAGHGGTLDPQVTGVLPVALQDATRVIKTMLEAPKEYVVEMELNREVPEERVRETLGKFVGRIWQVPPREAAVKRELRARSIYSIDVLEVEPRAALFRCSCEAGTYMRNLAKDVGTVLLVGGRMRALRRTKTGPFREDTTVTLHDLRDAFADWKENNDERELRRVVRPVEDLVAHLPRVEIRDGAVDAICHGASLAVPGVARVDEAVVEGRLVAVFSLKGELVSVGAAAMDAKRMAEEEKGLAVKTTRVVMDPGTYARGWK